MKIGDKVKIMKCDSDSLGSMEKYIGRVGEIIKEASGGGSGMAGQVRRRVRLVLADFESRFR